MARWNLKREENVEGSFFTDSTCIDCGTCYWMAEETFEPINGKSAVTQQPKSAKAVDQAYGALLSCPTNSIGYYGKEKIGSSVAQSFPQLIDDDVYLTGFHDESSFGAASYFIKTKAGNTLIDSPRYTKLLCNRFTEMGGIDLQLLTHKDDIAATNRYFAEFSTQRMLHKDDRTTDSNNFEHYFQGNQAEMVNDELLMIPTPGHTKGSVCYLYKNKYLFTGDHLAWSKKLGHLYAFKNSCWYDFDRQIESMETLLQYDFEYVLPGHGAPCVASKESMKKNLKKCIDWMENA